jgi:iron(III) transport system permease protein
MRPRRRRVTRARIGTAVAVGAFTAGLGYLTVVPLVRLQALAFEDRGQGFVDAFTRPGIWTTIRMTIALALGSLAIALVFGTALAWAANSLSPRLRPLRALPILPIVVPAIASVLGWGFLFSPRPGYLNALLRHLPWWTDIDQGPINIYSLPWIIIITGLALAAFVYLFVSASLESINGELIEAAQVSGSSRAGVFFRVTLPLLRPALVYGGGVALLLGLGQFTAPLLLGRTQGVSVLTTEMYFATKQEPAQYALAAALGSPLLLFGVGVLVLQRVLLGDHARFVTHGSKGFRPAARSSRLGAVAILLYTLFATVLPIVALVIVALSTWWTGDIVPSTFTLDNFRNVIETSGITSAIRTSLIVSVIAVGIALPVGFIAASILYRRREHRLMGPVLDFIVAMPLSIPAVIFGLGFLLTYTQGPVVLYGTNWVMILVYVTLMLPFSTRMQLSGRVALGDAYIEASRVSGAGPVRTNLSILAPLMRPTFGAAAALMFVLLANEFTASLLVRSPTVQVMGTVLFDTYDNGLYPVVACVALIMILVTALGVLLAVLLSGSDAFRRL